MKRQEVGNYVLDRTLGSGATGKVKLAQRKDNGDQVAIKIIKKSQFDVKPDMQKKIRREIALMRLLDHPHLLKLIEVCESPRHLYMVLEYASNGELFDFLVLRKKLEPSIALEFFRQLIYGLDYLHQHGICHRDLKPENLLLDQYNRIKIADFGFARWMQTNIVETSCGSPHYASPEVIKGFPYDGRMADIWSCGVIFYALINGKLPFDEPSVRQLLQKVKSGGYTMPSDVPDLIADLIRKILVVDPQKRITLKGIKAHPAFRSYLPPEYPLPVPLPLPSLRDPIDPSTIEPFILSILKAIGYASEDDVKKELLEDHQTMAKVFYHMSVTRMSIEGYEWSDDDESENEDSNHNNEDSENQDDDGSIGNDPFMMPPREIPTMSIQTSDPFKRRRINNEVSSMDSSIRSLAQPVGWGETDVPESVYEDEQIFTSIQAPLSTLIVTLIKMIGKHEMEWKYPDDMTLICRRMDKTLYILFKIYYETKDTLDLQVLLNRGSSHEFNIFIQYVMTAIESMMNEIEEVKC